MQSAKTALQNLLPPPVPFFILSFHLEDVQLFVPKSADTSANLGLVRPNVLPCNIGYGSNDRFEHTLPDSVSTTAGLTQTTMRSDTVDGTSYELRISYAEIE